MNSDANDRTTDRRVSETYRGLATERPPAHLDRTVLRMARKEGQTPYAAARAWMRPFGWAATIVLCFAIVIQLTQLPRDAVDFDAPASAEHERVAGSPTTTQSAEPAATDRSQAQSEMPAAAPGKKQPGDDWRGSSVPSMAGKTATFSKDSARKDKNAAAPAVAPVSSRANESQDAVTTEILPRRERAAANRALEDIAVEARSMTAEAARATDPLCPQDARDSAARWYECIESLREVVAEDRLAQELEEFDAAYPGYVPEDRSGR